MALIRPIQVARPDLVSVVCLNPLVLKLSKGARLNFEGMDFDGFLTVLDLPEGCGPEQCRVGITRVHADIGSFSGTTNALVLICDWKGHRRILSIHDFIVQCALRFLLTLPMVPGSGNVLLSMFVVGCL